MIVHSSKSPLIIREAVSNSIIEENKATIKKIMDKIFPIACKILDKVTKESDFKYLCEKKYYLPKNIDCYTLPDPNGKYDFFNTYEDHEYYFGIVTLFEVSTKKAYSNNDKNEYDEFDWNGWQNTLFKLCKELNANKEISKYGKAYTEQPDDGDQINFKINRDLLNTNTTELKKNGLDVLSIEERKKLLRNLEKIVKEIYISLKDQLSKNSIPGKVFSPYFIEKYAWNIEYHNNKNSTTNEEIPAEYKQKIDNIISKITSKYKGINIKHTLSTRKGFWEMAIIISIDVNDDNYMNFLK